MFFGVALPPLSMFATVFVALSALLAAGHAVCYKRDSRSAVTWVIFIFFAPLLGALIYFWVGVNRVRARARFIRSSKQNSLKGRAAPILAHPHPALTLAGKINHERLYPGNKFEMLVNGNEAYPRMLQAIREAKKTITLLTYIFDNDPVGREFAQALCEAGERGVQVRVLIDAMGARYSFPSIYRHLRANNLKVDRFLDTILPWRFHYSQLRNHRKCLIADGALAFIGGMNIRDAHVVSADKAGSTQDLQFQVQGPVVGDLQKVFAEDWRFTNGEELKGSDWFPALAPVESGKAWARVVDDGPDEEYDKLHWTLLGAIAEAKKSISIATPYFVPDGAIIPMLGLAAQRGVRVEILLPEHNNVLLVQWASRSLLWQVLEKGCHVYSSPPPFDHSKIFLVDDAWACIGSANWDARSLRLNFELNVEVQDPEFTRALAAEFARKRVQSREVTLAEVDARPLPVRLRDGVARLFSPFL